jgi:hypothetical protein
MPDGLYDQDILAWSTRQADLLRRLGRGERVNDVDWDNIAEEIESVGRSEWHEVESFIALIVLHLLKLNAWPDHEAANHWRGEVVTFQTSARNRFAPSMRQKLDIDQIYADTIRRLKAEAPSTGFPEDNPFTLDDLLSADWQELLRGLRPSA